jgi:hypothetical protein
MKRRARSSNSIRSARSSVLRHTRDTSDTTMMPRMKLKEMAMPSGFSSTFSTSAYTSTRVTRPNPATAAGRRRRRAATVTANAAETIMARMPVAYAPAWASTSALKMIVVTTARAV